MNTNGVVSLDSPFTSSSAGSFPWSTTVKVIAPYWSDVDTRGTGQIFYRQSTDPSLLARASNEIEAAYSFPRNVAITHLFIVTWDAVGYYSRRIDKVLLCMWNVVIKITLSFAKKFLCATGLFS